MKIVIAHPSQQHSFRLATAMKNAGCLDKYITTVYLKNKSLTRLIMPFLPAKFRKRAETRVCKSLDDCDVIQFCEFEGLLRLFTQNVSFLKKYHNRVRYHLADRFAKRVAKYAIKNKVDAVITYDDCSPLLFEILKKKAPNIKRILDTSAANRLYMKQIYDVDLDLAPKFAQRLKQEVPQVWNNRILDRVKREIYNSEYFLVPSCFVAKSLKFSGIKDEQIFMCPYGVDIEEFKCKSFDMKIINRPIEFIYIGGVKELKGIFYLLEAFKNIPIEKAQLTVVGSYNANDADILEYIDKVTFTGMVLHSKIPDLLRRADVFIMPSLGDSFALSAMEAAASGLPIILSENTGASDQITNGQEGFIIPIQSIEDILDKVNWFIDNPNNISIMGKRARQMTQNLSWDEYNKCCINLVKRIIN